METVVANVTGKVRREKRGGRDYFVVPMSLLPAEGVLAGSEGGIFYPADEIAMSERDWDGMPVVDDHPTANGAFVSARDPEILAEKELGRVFRTRYGDKLVSEGWLDSEQTRRVNPRIHAAIERGETIELSTGLNLVKVPAAEGAVHNGKPYSHVGRNYKPDHVAILIDKVGACGTRDGCGVNNAAKGAARKDVWYKLGVLLGLLKPDEEADAAPTDAPAAQPPAEEPAMNRAATIDFLTANCECWKDGKSDLEKLSDATLTKLEADSKKTAETVANAAKPVPVAVPATTATPTAQISRQEFDELTASIKALTANVQQIAQQDAAQKEASKKAMVEALTANAAPEDAQRKAAFYQTMSAEQLSFLLAEQGRAVPQPVPNWGGAAPAVAANAKDDSANLLPQTEVDFTPFASPKLVKTA